METIDIPFEVSRQLINAAKEYASETSGSVIVNNPEKYKAYRAGQDSGIKILGLQKQQDKAVIERATDLLKEFVKMHYDSTYGDLVWRLAVVEKTEQLLSTIQ